MKQPKYITKKPEYRILLELIKKHKLFLSKGKGYNIQAIVKTLHIDPKTARKWLNTPKVQEAISEEIEFYVSKMQEVGATDWKMWARQIEFASKNKMEDSEEMGSNVIIIRDKEKGIFRITDELPI
jgi:hypothetical protein